MSQSHVTDAVHAVTRAVLTVFAPLLREEEQREAYLEVEARVREVLTRFEVKRERMARRIGPTGGGP